MPTKKNVIKKKNIKKKKIPKVMIAIPNQGTVTCNLAKQLVEIVTDSAVNKKFNIDLRFSKVTCIDYNRNTITRMFLESDCDFLLMIDDDNPCLKNPLDLIELNKDIMIYPTLMFKVDGGREPILQYNVFKKDGNMWRSQRMTPGKKLEEYDAGGTGCILIKRKVLEKIKAPFLSKMNEDGTRNVGMDLWFCHRAKKAGFRIWAHWDYACQHIKEIDLLDVGRMMLRDLYKIGEDSQEGGSPLIKLKEKK